MLLSLALALALAAPAAGVYSGRANQLKVTVPRLDAAIVVDGVLDETAWQQAARLTDFSEYAPVDGRPAADDRTEVLVFYTPTAIYFGVRAHEPAGGVHATLANRDNIDADDSIQIFLNTFNDGRQALVFGVNPLGVQADGTLVEGTGNRGGAAFSALESGREVTDLTPDYVYESKGRLTDDGYEIEIEIPFKTLRFPAARVQAWGVNVLQRVQSTGHEHTWTPALRANTSFLAQSGELDGLHDLKRGLVLDLNPVVTAKADGAAGEHGWTYDAGRPEFGGNLRWGVTPNLTLNGTVNPDFSQVEADAGQFVFDPRSALYFPEKRPFFLDGAELFSAPNNLIYTRRIVAPVAAAKLTGQMSGTTIAVLSAVDDLTASASGADHPVVNIVRLQHDLSGQSKIGMVFTDRARRRGLERGRRRRRAARVRIELQPAAPGGREPDGHRGGGEGRPDLAGDLQPRRPSLRIQVSGDRHPRELRRPERLHQPRRHRPRQPQSPRDVLRRREGDPAKLDDRHAARRRLAVPRDRHRRAVAREEAALQQQLHLQGRLAGGRVGAVRIVRVRPDALHRLRDRAGPQPASPRPPAPSPRPRASWRSPARRTCTTRTTC